MSACRPESRAASRPNWIVNAWNSAALDVLDYQWSVAEEFWREIDRQAADLDVKVALELHPQNLVFNPAGIRELVERTGATNIGVELDASHLFWQWMDPVAVVQDLGPLVFHCRGQGRTHQSRRRCLRRARQPVPPAGAGRAAHQPRRRRVGQRVAEGRRMGLRRTRPRARRRLLVDLARRLVRRSTPTCSSTSSTRTSRSAASRASRLPPRCCSTPHGARASPREGNEVDRGRLPSPNVMPKLASASR